MMAEKKDKNTTLLRNDGRKERTKRLPYHRMTEKRKKKPTKERWQKRKTRTLPYYGTMAKKRKFYYKTTAEKKDKNNTL